MANLGSPLVDGSVAWNDCWKGCYRSISHLEGFHHCEDFSVIVTSMLIWREKDEVYVVGERENGCNMYVGGKEEEKCSK